MGKKNKTLEIIETNLSVSVSKKVSDNNYGNNSVMLTVTKKVTGDVSLKQRNTELEIMFEELNDKADSLVDLFNE